MPAILCWFVLILVHSTRVVESLATSIARTTDFPQQEIVVLRSYYDQDDAPCLDFQIAQRGCKVYATYECHEEMVVDEMWLGPATLRMFETSSWCFPKAICRTPGQEYQRVRLFCTDKANTDLELLLSYNDHAKGDETCQSPAENTAQLTVYSTPGMRGGESCSAIHTTITLATHRHVCDDDGDEDGSRDRYSYAIQTPGGGLRLHDFLVEPIFGDVVPLTRALLVRGGGVALTNTSGLADGLTWLFFPVSSLNTNETLEGGAPVILDPKPIAVRGPIPHSCHAIWNKLLAVDLPSVVREGGMHPPQPIETSTQPIVWLSGGFMRTTWLGLIGSWWTCILLALCFRRFRKRLYIVMAGAVTLAWNIVAYTGVMPGPLKQCFYVIVGGSAGVLFLKTASFAISTYKYGFVIPVGADAQSFTLPAVVCIYSISLGFLWTWVL